MTKKLITLILVLSIALLLSFGAKTCASRNNSKTKSGSSNYNAFVINAPSRLTATAISYSQIDLSWQDNSNNEDGFRIERLTFPVTTFLLIATVGQDITSYLDSDLTSFTTYFYRIQAFNTISDTSEYSNIANISTVITFSVIAAGEAHTIALANDGTIWSWGLNDYYQLGLGYYSPILVTMPTQIGSDTDWSIIIPGQGDGLAGGLESADNTICCKMNGTMWSWGKNYYGKLGLGYSSAYGPSEPTQVGFNSDWSLVSAGAYHSLAIKTNKILYSWGYNAYGQLGLGNNYDKYIPSQVGIDTDWSQIAAGYQQSLAIKNSGTIWAWGDNSYGQLGLGNGISGINTPSQIGTQADWFFVSTGGGTSVAIKTDMSLWSWGDNRSGQLGIGSVISQKYIPTLVGTNYDWIAVSARNVSVLAIRSNGTIWSWGVNNLYNLGLGDIIERSVPSQIGSESDWNEITFGGYNGFAKKSDNTFWCWGDNSYGQLGFGDTIARSIPHQFGSPFPPSSLNLTVVSDSQINLSWNDNSANELGFIIERKISGTDYSLLAAVNANTTSYYDTTALSGNTYYYRIRSFTAFANSNYTSSTNEITPGLYSPSLTVMVISSTQISLSFNDSNPDESGFEIERSTDGITWTFIATATVNTYFDNNVTQGNTYYYRVCSFNSFVSSNWSDSVTPSLAQPSASLLVINSSQIDLSWTDESPDESGFRIERKIGIDGTWGEIGTVGANATTYSDTTVSAPTVYYYRVQAFNAFVNSLYSDEIYPSLDYPYVALLVINASQINLSLEDYNSDEAGFRIERRISPTGYSLLATVGADITSYQDTTVSPGNVYWYHVRAFNAFVNSSYSIDKTPLLNPTYLDANVTGGQFSQINLSWGDYNQDEFGFQIERKTGGTGTWSIICTVGVSPLSYSDTTVTYGNTYYYKIKAFNPFIGSAYSSETPVNNILPPPVCYNSYTYVISDTIRVGWIIRHTLKQGFKLSEQLTFPLIGPQRLQSALISPIIQILM
jgi:alpha-tubulin suppressor-like RCC1 family protein/fibronectin type 3 domain-containing protein